MMKNRNPQQPPDALDGNTRSKNIFALCAGAILGICLNKFGNPIILDPILGSAAGFNSPANAMDGSAPFPADTSLSNLEELVYQPWPAEWSWRLMGLLLIAGCFFIKRNQLRFNVLLIFPSLWLLWQAIASANSINPLLSKITLIHFIFCLGSFFLGWFVMSHIHKIHWLWLGLLIGFLSTLWNGLGQHYGGLEATRQYIYENSDVKRMSPLFLQRLSSTRIFSTFVYPNAFAGAIILLLPPCLVVCWQMTSKFRAIYSGILVGSIAYVALACLVWTGSKAGWLIALGMFIVLFAHFQLRRRIKISVALLIVGLGLVAFFLRYDSYFKKGATSVSARFDYWQAAFKTANAHPWTGTGPGTFADSYKKIKSPESEMARLVHNDFLEQASDSGWIGFVLFGAFIGSSFLYLYRKRVHWLGPVPFAVWLGLIGFTAQCFVEFGLYIPALAWLYFLLLGWLLSLTPPPGTERPLTFKIQLIKSIN